ncbi:hypothetical protein H4R19_003833 [Coemansia spiralis]|nr:hypothetical protein H4R19_003833 [Coemansia spiralis]
MPKKLLAVGVPAALNLRAELARAQDESRSSTRRHAAAQPGVLGAPNHGVEARARGDALALGQERASRKQAGARARQALEEKARIYDMLSGLDRDSADTAPRIQLDEARLAKILDESAVDFARKRREHAAASAATASDGECSTASDGSMVEIVDEFGRSRLVPRSKAREYRRSDSDSDSNASDDAHTGRPPPRRNHGAGFYHLSADFAEREEQLAALHRLHKETEEERLAASASTAGMQAQQLARRRDQLLASLRQTAPLNQ